MFRTEYPHIFGATVRKGHGNLARGLCTPDLGRSNPIQEHYAFLNLVVA
jgi:hypothetical protein